MRAAFKAAMDGKQVAVLAPTTVLAFQHMKTLKSRFAAFPVRTDLVSRFRTKAEQKADPRGSRRRQSRHHRRHPPSAVEGRRVQGSRIARRGRGAALRRRAQGADQTAPQARGCVDDDGDADSADAEHVAGRHPRHVGDRNAAARPALDPDQRHEVRPDGDLAGDPDRARARRPGLFRPQPRRVHLFARRSDHAARAGSEAGGGARADGGGGARARDGRFRRAQVRRPSRHHHHRERPRHPQRQHDDRQPRGSLRPRAALSDCAAGSAGRTVGPTPT